MKKTASSISLLAITFILFAAIASAQEWKGKEHIDQVLNPRWDTALKLEKGSTGPLQVRDKFVYGASSAILFQRIHDKKHLISLEYGKNSDIIVMAKGFDFSGKADGQGISLDDFGIVTVTGMETYKTPTATKTVFVLQPYRATAKGVPFLRTWTNAKHGSKIEAAFYGFTRRTVMLMKADQKIISIRFDMLSAEDQRHVLKLNRQRHKS